MLIHSEMKMTYMTCARGLVSSLKLLVEALG